jgi:hypothetical protein
MTQEKRGRGEKGKGGEKREKRGSKEEHTHYTGTNLFYNTYSFQP